MLAHWPARFPQGFGMGRPSSKPQLHEVWTRKGRATHEQPAGHLSRSKRDGRAHKWHCRRLVVQYCMTQATRVPILCSPHTIVERGLKVQRRLPASHFSPTFLETAARLHHAHCGWQQLLFKLLQGQIPLVTATELRRTRQAAVLCAGSSHCWTPCGEASLCSVRIWPKQQAVRGIPIKHFLQRPHPPVTFRKKFL